MGDFPVGFGRYSLVERLAVGGMAELFVATSPGEHGFQKKVVIKRLLPHLADDQTYNAMFIDEAKLTARLVHPKIAQTFELGKVDDALYIAMEHIDGIDVLALLREFAARRRRVEPQLAVWIAHEVLDALDYAHQLPDEQGHAMGVVHRDISPSNVLLSLRGDVKLVDFGIARAKDPGRAHKSKSGTLKGKYGYMSPEQVLEQPVDARSDVFSVGVVIAELLTGRRLFAAPNELDVLLMVRDAKLARLDKYGADIEPALNELVRKALRKSPEDRWQSAAAFREALAEWLFDHRHRMSNKQVADVVHDLREAVEERRVKQMADGGHTAVLDDQGAAAAAGSVAAGAVGSVGGVPMPGPAVGRVPSETDAAPVMTIEHGDSMPVISVSYDAGEAEAASKRPVSVSDLAATAATAQKRAETVQGRPRTVAVQVPPVGGIVSPEAHADAPSHAPAEAPAQAVAQPHATAGRARLDSGPPAEIFDPAPAGAPDLPGRRFPREGTPPPVTTIPAVARTATSSTSPPASSTYSQQSRRDDGPTLPRTATSSAGRPAVARTATPAGGASRPAVARTATPPGGVARPAISRTMTPRAAHEGMPPLLGRTPTPYPTAQTSRKLSTLEQLALDRARDANAPATPATRGAAEDAVEAIADTISAAVEAIMEPAGPVEHGPYAEHAEHASAGAAHERSEDSVARAFDDLTGDPELARGAVPLPSAEELATQRPPAPPPVGDIAEAPDDSGDFGTTSPLRVLFRLMTARATGLLVVAVGGIKKEIYVRDGQPEYVSSNVASELFGNYLVTKGVLSDGELAMALAMMPHYGGKLGDTLVGLGLLKPLEVFRHLTRQVRSKIIDVCTWNKGGFGWYSGRENPREAFPLDFNAFEILGAGAMALADDVIDVWIARNSALRLRASRTRRVGPERFEVKGLVELFETLDGRRSVGDLVELHHERGERLKAGRMLCLLEACDLAKAS